MEQPPNSPAISLELRRKQRNKLAQRAALPVPQRLIDIEADKTTTLTLDFDAEASVVKSGRDKYKMNPTIKIIDESGESGAKIMANFGTKIVYNKQPNTAISVYQKDCRERSGTFKECGNGCDPESQICDTTCTYICEFS